MRTTLLALALLATGAAPAFAQATFADPPGNDRVIVYRPQRTETKVDAPGDDLVIARKPRIERPVFIPPQRRVFDEPTVSDRGESIVPPMFDTFTVRPAFTSKPHEPHRGALAPQGVPQRPAVVIVHRPMHPAWQPMWRR